LRISIPVVDGERPPYLFSQGTRIKVKLPAGIDGVWRSRALSILNAS